MIRLAWMKTRAVNAIVNLEHLVLRNANYTVQILGEVSRKCEVITHEWAIKASDALVSYIGAIQIANVATVFSMNADWNTGQPGRQLNFKRSQVTAMDNRWL